MHVANTESEKRYRVGHGREGAMVGVEVFEGR